MSSQTIFQVSTLTALALAATSAFAGDYEPLSEKQIKKLEHVTQTLVDPPFFPEHKQVADEGFKVVEIYLPIEEKIM